MPFHWHVLELQLLEKQESQFPLLQGLCVPYSSYPPQSHSIAAGAQEKTKSRRAFRWTFQINSLFLDTAWGHWLLRVGGTKITRSWGGGGRVSCPQSSRAEKQILMDCPGQRKCEAGKQNHFFTGHYIKLTQKLYFTKALIEHFSVFQEFKGISRNGSVILGNYKPHRELTFSYTTHRGWIKSELFFFPPYKDTLIWILLTL